MGDPSHTLRIATLNILHDPPTPSWPDRAHLVVAGFRALGADVILLQEVAWPNEQASDLAAALTADTGSTFKAQITPLLTPHGWQEGLAILTRFPVLAHDALRYPAAECFCQRVRLELSGRVVDTRTGEPPPTLVPGRSAPRGRTAVPWDFPRRSASALSQAIARRP